MKTRITETIARRDKGYNCAQAVACTYSDLVGIDEAVMFRMTEALGRGMGNTEGTCGAVSGACVLAGMKGSSGNLKHPDSKEYSYELSGAIAGQFEAQNRSLVCKLLKGTETGVALRSCEDCIMDAARLAEQVLFSDMIET